MNWAQVTPGESGLAGFQVWEFYEDGWEADLDEAFYLCHVVQDVAATVSPCPAEGVPFCRGAYQVTLSPSEDDCLSDLAGLPGLDGPPWVAIGSLPDDIASDASYTDWSLGWYTAWQRGAWDAFGWAYPKVLEDGGTPETGAWTPGQQWVLLPAWVWEL
jgi:hypothetical protein